MKYLDLDHPISDATYFRPLKLMFNSDNSVSSTSMYTGTPMNHLLYVSCSRAMPHAIGKTPRYMNEAFFDMQADIPYEFVDDVFEHLIEPLTEVEFKQEHPDECFVQYVVDKNNELWRNTSGISDKPHNYIVG